MKIYSARKLIYWITKYQAAQCHITIPVDKLTECEFLVFHSNVWLDITYMSVRPDRVCYFCIDQTDRGRYTGIQYLGDNNARQDKTLSEMIKACSVTVLQFSCKILTNT